MEKFLSNSRLFFRIRGCPLLLCAGMSLLSSCNEELPDPLFTQGMIYGRVEMDDWDNSPDDVKVLALGPYEELSATTNQGGNYELGGLGNGTYELEFSKDGFGTMKAHGIQIFGNDTLRRNTIMYEMMGALKVPKLIEVLTSSTSDWLYPTNIAITTSLSTTKETNWGYRLFFAKHPEPSYRDYYCHRNGRRLRRNGYDNILITAEDLPFEGGEKIYLIAYVCNPRDEGYWDAYQGRLTFSTLNPEEHSQVMQFTMPLR